MHPRSRQWHQLHLVITKRDLLNSKRITRTYHSADCDTDNSLVLSKITLSTKKLHYAKGLPENKSGHTNVNLNVMKPLTAAKRSALIQYKKNPIRKKSGLLARSKKKESKAGKALCK